MKRILVIGGSGGIGQYVIRHLLEQGYEVINVDVAPPIFRAQMCSSSPPKLS